MKGKRWRYLTTVDPPGCTAGRHCHRHRSDTTHSRRRSRSSSSWERTGHTAVRSRWGGRDTGRCGCYTPRSDGHCPACYTHTLQQKDSWLSVLPQSLDSASWLTILAYDFNSSTSMTILTHDFGSHQMIL